MELKNCPHCGKLFAYDGQHKLCKVCRKEEDDDFQKVKEYLWDNPHATIEEVYEETGVERELIIKFVKEDRLIAEGIDVDFMLECERCGASISRGRYCEKCQQELKEGFSADFKKKEKTSDRREKDKMYIKDRIRKRKEQ